MLLSLGPFWGIAQLRGKTRHLYTQADYMSLQDIGVKGFMQLFHYTFKPLATKKLWFKQD